MKLFVSGVRTTIWREMRGMIRTLADDTTVVACQSDFGALDWRPDAHIPICDRYLLAMGHLWPSCLRDQGTNEVKRSLAINLIAPMRIIDRALEMNPEARICVIGSESGLRGSFNEVYGAAKAGLHHYIETRPVGPDQQLVGIAPSMIEDSGMTTRRADQENVDARREAHPKGRLLMAREVAALAFHLLFSEGTFATNIVIPMLGRPR